MPGVIGGVFYLLFLVGILGAIIWCQSGEQQGSEAQRFRLFFAMSAERIKPPPRGRMPGHPQGAANPQAQRAASKPDWRRA